VGVALDWRWHHGDGDLSEWTIGDVSEFLLAWCPRKLSASAAECQTIPGALVAFVEFLDDEGLLGAGSAPAAHLGQVVHAMSGEFVASMADPSKFGLAKSPSPRSPPKASWAPWSPAPSTTTRSPGGSPAMSATSSTRSSWPASSRVPTPTVGPLTMVLR